MSEKSLGDIQYSLLFHINGLVQQRPNYIANELSYVFLALTHRYEVARMRAFFAHMSKR